MLPVLNNSEAYLLDKVLQDTYGIPESILMENAANSIFQLIKNFDFESVLLLCGTGNNGGDGLVLARLLLSLGKKVKVLYFGDTSKSSYLNKLNYNVLSNISSDSFIDYKSTIEGIYKYDVIIDSIYGIGFKGSLGKDTLALFNLIKSSNSLKIAIDVPSGINDLKDLGFRFDQTFTMFGFKDILLNVDYKGLIGKVEVLNLNIPKEILLKSSQKYVLEDSDIKNFISKRNPNTSKFDYGSILMLCGSEAMPGAAYLASKSAISSGAGLVYTLGFDNSHFAPEIIKLLYDNSLDEFLNKYQEILKRVNVILIGPGLGKDSEIFKQVPQLIEKYKDKYFVIDGDAIQYFENFDGDKRTVFTPHQYEYKRLANQEDIRIKDLALKLNSIILLKGNITQITDGTTTYFNTSGNAGMATAGSGDVLAGIISSFIAQGKTPLEASAFGSFIHGRCADSFVAKYSETTLTASSLIDELKFVI